MFSRTRRTGKGRGAAETVGCWPCRRSAAAAHHSGVHVSETALFDSGAIGGPGEEARGPMKPKTKSSGPPGVHPEPEVRYEQLMVMVAALVWGDVTLVPSGACALADQSPEIGNCEPQAAFAGTVPLTVTVTLTLSWPANVSKLAAMMVALLFGERLSLPPVEGFSVTDCTSESQPVVPPWIFRLLNAPLVQLCAVMAKLHVPDEPGVPCCPDGSLLASVSPPLHVVEITGVMSTSGVPVVSSLIEVPVALGTQKLDPAPAPPPLQLPSPPPPPP